MALARLYQQAGQAKKAVTILRRAAKVLPESVVAVLSSLVDAYVSQERPADGKWANLPADRCDPQASDGRVQSEALAAYQRAVEMASHRSCSSSATHRAIAGSWRGGCSGSCQPEGASPLFLRRGYVAPRPALEALNQLIELRPERLSARRLRAEVYEKLGASDGRRRSELNQFYLRSTLAAGWDPPRDRGDWARAAATLREAPQLLTKRMWSFCVSSSNAKLRPAM